MAEVFREAAIEAARIAGDDTVMDRVAARIAAKAKADAASRTAAEFPGLADNTPQRLAAGIGWERTPGKRGVTDRAVTMDHPAAAHIEFGHFLSGAAAAGGKVRRVKGLYILKRAAGG